jgi:DNA polymerase I-like protein with 3'-5' exonuclease and polymerase domains
MLDKQIIFITNRKHSIKNSDIIIHNSLDILEREFKDCKEVAFDREFNSLVPQYAQPLLSQYGFKDKVIVVDDTSMDVSPLLEGFSDRLFIGQNIEIDYRITKYHNNVSLRNLWDTVLVERELRKGAGHTHTLADILLRRVGIELSKTERERFRYLSKTSIFIDQDIVYAARDVMYMHELKKVQQEKMDEFNLNFLLKGIRFKMIPPLSDASLEGIEIIEDKNHPRYDGYCWKDNIHEAEEKAESLKKRLDSILIELNKDGSVIFKDTLTDLMPIIANPRRKQKLVQTNLFGEETLMSNANPRNINYSSSVQLKKIFNTIGIPVPTIMEKDLTMNRKITKESFKEAALEKYKIDQSGLMIEFGEFIDLLLDLKEVEKLLSSFGERFLYSAFKVKNKKEKLGYKNRITGRVHTIYSQSTTATGRLTSGKEKEGFFNSQQTPKKESYRHCMTTEDGYCITTADLSGAELVIAASLSLDPRLIELVKSEDQHSPLAEVGYNAIIECIMDLPTNEKRKKQELADLLKPAMFLLKNKEEKTEKQILKERVNEAYSNHCIRFNKEYHNDIRDKYKAVNYGLAYGAGVERIKEILNINVMYAEAVEKAMREELPVLFKYLDDNATKGLAQGYIIFNKRTNSRHWFKAMLDAKKYKKELKFGDEKQIERLCKNYPIQGTQGDMIMEATVNFFHGHVYAKNHDVTLLLHVHDEMAIKHKISEPFHKEVLQKAMIDAANVYLDKSIKMKCEPQTLLTWTK